MTQSLPRHRGGGGSSLGCSRALDPVPAPDGPGGKPGDPGDLCLAPCTVSPQRWGLQTCPRPPPWAVPLWFLWWVFFKLVLFAFFLPKPCPRPSVGLNKQSLNTPVCVGGVDADGVCGPPCLVVSPALPQDLVPGAALELRRRKGLLLFPEPLPIQELGSARGTHSGDSGG